MTPEEANKIIAKYMGVPWCPCNDGTLVEAHDLHPRYSNSLDSLVPVWEKMGVDIEIDLGKDDNRVTVCTNENCFGYIKERCPNLFSAAVIATARTIQLLELE